MQLLQKPRKLKVTTCIFDERGDFKFIDPAELERLRRDLMLQEEEREQRLQEEENLREEARLQEQDELRKEENAKTMLESLDEGPEKQGLGHEQLPQRFGGLLDPQGQERFREESELHHDEQVPDEKLTSWLEQTSLESTERESRTDQKELRLRAQLLAAMLGNGQARKSLS